MADRSAPGRCRRAAASPREPREGALALLEPLPLPEPEPLPLPEPEPEPEPELELELLRSSSLRSLLSSSIHPVAARLAASHIAGACRPSFRLSALRML